MDTTDPGPGPDPGTSTDTAAETETGTESETGTGTDIAIDAALVRELLREQHPDLAGLPLRRGPRGWDNEMWRLGDELAVRLPRTPRAPDLLVKEHRWVPSLAARLPLPVPTPLRLGAPSPRFPKHWTVAAWVPGEPADRAPLRVGDGPRAADALAAFLRALHRPAPPDAPAGQDRGVPLHVVADGVEQGLRAFAADAATADLPLAAMRDVFAEAVAAPGWAGPPCWLHGDLHPANVVVADGTLAGVVDFGEVSAGDPATDLAAAWTLLPEGAAARFLAAYGAQADEATVRRARGWALRGALGLISVGLAGERGLPGGKPTWLPAGRATIARALAATSRGAS